MNNDSDIQTALEPVILLMVDAEKGEGKDLASEFKIRAYPTYTMVDKEGQVIDRWVGFSKNEFTATLADAILDQSTIVQKKTRFEAEPTLKLASVLGRYNSSIGEYREAVAYYLKAQTLADEKSGDFSYEIFDNTLRGISGGIFTYDEVVKASEKALAGLSKGDLWREIEVSGRTARLAARTGHMTDAAKYLQIGLDATAISDEPDIKKEHAKLMVDFSMIIKGDTATAVEYKKATLSDNWENDPSELNNLAWWCFENNANLIEAENLSQKSVDLAQPGKQKAMNLDTLAEIKHALGKTNEAIELSKKASSEDPSSDYYPKQVEKFQAALSPSK